MAGFSVITRVSLFLRSAFTKLLDEEDTTATEDNESNHKNREQYRVALVRSEHITYKSTRAVRCQRLKRNDSRREIQTHPQYHTVTKGRVVDRKTTKHDQSIPRRNEK